MYESNETSTKISATMTEKVTTSDMYCGDIIKLTKLLEPLNNKHALTGTDHNEETNLEFTQKISMFVMLC